MAQRGGFVIGIVVGLLIGLALALGVALYITKAPMPFVNKVPLRTAEQDSAEIERNSRWNPNAPLGAQRAAAGAASGAVGVTSTTGAASAASAASEAFGPPVVPPLLPPPAAQRASARPAPAAGPGVAGNASDAFVYFVQAGAFTRNEDAEQQRARLALAGQTARITEREQSGRTVYRVRLGPFSARDAADGLQERLQDQGIDSQIVRVERP